jgi:hypothetical protein
MKRSTKLKRKARKIVYRKCKYCHKQGGPKHKCRIRASKDKKFDNEPNENLSQMPHLPQWGVRNPNLPKWAGR